MSPIEKIKEAFLRKDWSIIQEAYNALTGQELEDTEPEVEKEYEEPIELPKAKKTRAKKSVTKEPAQSKSEDFTMPKRKVGSGGVVLVNGKEYNRMTVQQIDPNSIKNTFTDNSNLASADRKIDKKLKPRNLTERNRGEYSQVEANCVACGRLALVEPFEKKHYRCKYCMPKPG